MSPFADELLFDVALSGLSQLILAALVAVSVLPFIARYLRRGYGHLLCQFAVFNAFLFGWGALGNAAWLGLTWHRMSVADDVPVWAFYIPFGRFMLDHAAGSPDYWRLLGSTTITQLQVFWAITAIPVWLLSIFSMRFYVRSYSIQPSPQVA